MNDPSARERRSEKTSGRRRFESSTGLRQSAVADLDERLELRERLVAVIDELDAGDHIIAAANLKALLADLDEARVS